jgi:ribosomal protein S18 acetylase RimI-like enzyme
VIEDRLVQHVSRWLRQRGCKFGQAFLGGTETALGPVLQRNAYNHITNLLYLRVDLGALDNLGEVSQQSDLAYQDYTVCDRELFHATLLATYEDTLDCPELNDARTAEEIVAGYRAAEDCRLERWWLAWDGQRPAGVLILTEHAASATWELSYLGLVRWARGRGLGRTLTRKALCAAQTAGARCMMLTLDARNQPAWRLYRAFGFEVSDRREVYLSIFDKP